MIKNDKEIKDLLSFREKINNFSCALLDVVYHDIHKKNEQKAHYPLSEIKPIFERLIDETQTNDMIVCSLNKQRSKDHFNIYAKVPHTDNEIVLFKLPIEAVNVGNGKKMEHVIFEPHNILNATSHLLSQMEIHYNHLCDSATDIDPPFNIEYVFKICDAYDEKPPFYLVFTGNSQRYCYSHEQFQVIRKSLSNLGFYPHTTLL